MHHTALLAAIRAVCSGAIVLVASSSATSADRASTIAEVSLPGGLKAAMTAIGDPGPPDRAQFLVEFIRRSYGTPFGPRNDPRDAVLQSLLAALKAGEAATGPVETLPLPLSAKTWIDVVFGGRATPETLVSSILQSRSASLLYCALLSLDDDTRAWLAEQPDLLGELSSRHPVEFLAAAPGLLMAGGTVHLPGGDVADPIWQALVGKRPNDPAAFVKALVEADEGRLSRFVGALAPLTPDEIRLALNLESATDSSRVDSARRVYSVYQRLLGVRTKQQHAFARPPLDPTLLAVDLTAVATGGRPIPGTRAFWTAAFDGSSGRPAEVKRADFSDAGAPGEVPDFPWLCELVFKSEIDQHRRYAMVLFAARRLRQIARSNVQDAIDAVRGVGAYPALTSALERARVVDPAVFAAAVRRADAISVIADGERQRRALAQYQGALALVTRASSRGSVDAAGVSEFASALSAIPLSDRGDYEGRLACWLDGWVRAQSAALQNRKTGVTAGSIEEVFERAPGPFEQAALRLLAGAIPSEPRVFDWEGTRYRLDLRKAEATRIIKALGDGAQPYVSAAETMAAGADALGEAGLTRDRLRRIAEEIAAATKRDEPDDANEASGTPVEGESGVVKALERAASTGHTSAAARLAPALRVLADQLLARGLTELAYAAALGQRDGFSISAPDAARRHDFGTTAVLKSGSAWRLPVPGTDAAQHWRVAGSLLGLDVGLAKFSLVRLSFKFPSRRPTLGDADQRTFIDQVALVEPLRLTESDRDTIVAAIRKGRGRIENIRTAADASAVADRAGLGPVGRSLLPWIAAHDPERLAAFLSPREQLWVGLGDARPQALDAWGMPAASQVGCLCPRLIDRRPWELFMGRWNSGMPASAFPDLNLRLAELLTDLRMPAAVLGPVLTSATLDFINSVISRDPDDRRGMVEYVHALRSERVEQYLALLTADGPLVPIEEAGPPRNDQDSGSDRSIPGALR